MFFGKDEDVFEKTFTCFFAEVLFSSGMSAEKCMSLYLRRRKTVFPDGRGEETKLKVSHE